eukprot:IDg15003t1
MATNNLKTALKAAKIYIPVCAKVLIVTVVQYEVAHHCDWLRRIPVRSTVPTVLSSFSSQPGRSYSQVVRWCRPRVPFSASPSRDGRYCGGSGGNPHTKKSRESRMSSHGQRSAVGRVFIDKAVCV